MPTQVRLLSCFTTMAKARGNKEPRGSSDFKASIDVGFVLANLGDRPGSHLRLKSFKSRFAVQPELIVHYTADGFQIDSRPVSKTNEELLTDLLIAHPHVTASEFEDRAAEISVPRNRAREFLVNGKASGEIRVKKGQRNSQHHIWVGSKSEETEG